MSAILALGAAVLFGFGDFLGGVASRQTPPRVIATVTSLTGFVMAIPLLGIVGGTWSSGAVWFGGLAGVVGALALVALFDGLASGPFQLVSPISAVIGGAVPVLFGVLSGERPGTVATVGLLLTPAAVWILAGGTLSIPRRIERRPLVAAVVAGVGFGWFFVCLDATPDDAGFVPVVVAKFAALVALVGWNRGAGWERPSVRTLRVAGGSGLFDMSANGVFLAASTRGDLSKVGALVALYPAVNSLLAAGFLGERLGRLQFAGFVFAIGAGLLLAV